MKNGKKFLAIIHRVIVVVILLVAVVCVGTTSLLYLAYGSADLKPHTADVFWVSLAVLALAIFYIAKVLKPWDQIK